VPLALITWPIPWRDVPGWSLAAAATMLAGFVCVTGAAVALN
jgi:hypothetical protein